MIAKSLEASRTLTEAFKQLKEFISSYHFQDKDEEILFFKEVKPKLCSRLIYYRKVYNIEMNRPIGIDQQKEYLCEFLNGINKYNSKRLDFIRYYRSCSSHLDSLYFLRGQTDVEQYLETFSYELDSDITATGDWTPIAFSGNFDGKGHVIRGLNVNDAGTHQRAFIVELTDGTVKNLGIENAHIVGADEVAAIVACANRSVIEGCYVVNSYIEGNDRVGAIVGNLQYGSIVQNCYASADVKARSWQTGGLIGATWRGNATDNPMEVVSSYFSGTVTGTWGCCCGILGLINADATVNIESCVNLASTLSDGTVLRIADVNDLGWTSYSLMNNYSLSSTMCNADIIPDTDFNYGANNRHGANITGGDEAALTEAFYQGLGWDFDDVWTVLAGSYPVFKWQGSASTSIKNQEDNIILYSENNTIFAVSKSPIEQLSAYDIKGSLVYNGKELNASAQFDVNATGIYVVKILTEQGIKVGKLIVE